MDRLVWVFLDLAWEGKHLWTTLGQRACWNQHTHACAHAEKLASIALSDSKTEACSVHTQRDITCMSSHASQEKKKFGKFGCRPYTSSELCLCVKQCCFFTPFHCKASKRQRNGYAWVPFGYIKTIFYHSVLKPQTYIIIIYNCSSFYFTLCGG